MANPYDSLTAKELEHYRHLRCFAMEAKGRAMLREEYGEDKREFQEHILEYERNREWNL